MASRHSHAPTNMINQVWSAGSAKREIYHETHCKLRSSAAVGTYDNPNEFPEGGLTDTPLWKAAGLRRDAIASYVCLGCCGDVGQSAFYCYICFTHHQKACFVITTPTSVISFIINTLSTCKINLSSLKQHETTKVLLRIADELILRQRKQITNN